MMTEWRSQIGASDLIFVSAPGVQNVKTLYFENGPFAKGDHRVRQIPFTTRRPTLDEIKRIMMLLSSIEFLQVSPSCDRSHIE